VSIESAVESGRRLVETTLLDTATIKRRAQVSDGAGGTTPTWTNHATAVPCRFGTPQDLKPDALHTARVADTVYAAATCLIIFAYGTDVMESDQIVNEATGKVWLVIGNVASQSAMATSARFTAREM
jgi:hypothetical protein